LAFAQKYGTEYFTCFANVEFIRGDERSVYCACPDCKKKLTKDISEEHYHCIKCDKSVPNPKHSYILNIVISDGLSSPIYSTVFSETAELILGGFTADEAVKGNFIYFTYNIYY
jgi:ribosomal protein L37AE/L43A